MPTTNRPRHAVETEVKEALGRVLSSFSRIPLVRPLIVIAAVLVLMAVAVPVWGASADLQRADVHRLSDLSAVQSASAQLTRTDSGVSFNLRTSGFEPGHVATVWWVVFNNPDQCDNPIPAIGANCNLPDLFDPDVEAAVMFAAGNVVGQSGRTSFGGHLQRGQVTTTHPLFADSPGLIHPRTAEIHLVDRTHGPLIRELVRGMLTTFEGGCTPATSAGSGDGPNDCADLHAAAFPAP